MKREGSSFYHKNEEVSFLPWKNWTTKICGTKSNKHIYESEALHYGVFDHLLCSTVDSSPSSQTPRTLQKKKYS